MDSYRTPGGIVVPAAAVRFSFSRAGGPGGQHVNTSATRVRAVLSVTDCGLDDATFDRVVATVGGEIVAVASEERSQHRNRAAALSRVLARLDDAAAVPVERVATRPTAGSAQRRLDEKRRLSQRKAERRSARSESW